MIQESQICVDCHEGTNEKNSMGMRRKVTEMEKEKNNFI